MRDVYLSHISNDKVRVRRLAERLQNAGVRVWLDEWILKTNDEVRSPSELGLANSRIVIVCLSEEYLLSEEAGRVLSAAKRARQEQILLLMDDCASLEAFSGSLVIDFRNETQDAFNEVLVACLPKGEAPKVEQSAVPQGIVESFELLATLDQTINLPASSANTFTIWGIKAIVAGGLDGSVKLRDLAAASKEWQILYMHKGSINGISISRDGRYLLSASEDGTIKLFDLSRMALVRVFATRGKPAKSVSLLPNGLDVFSLWDSPGHDAELRDLASGSCIWKAETSHGKQTSTFVSLDGKMGVSGSGTLMQFWNMRSGKCFHSIVGHSATINMIDITSDGNYAVSCSNDRTIKIWNFHEKSCLGSLEGHEGTVDTIAISPDGSIIASASAQDRSVRLWNFSSGSCLKVLTYGVYSILKNVAFAQDGRLFVLETAARKIYSYRVKQSNSQEAATETHRYINAKVVLVGESGAGKTALANRLISDEFVKTSSTHGMQVWRLNLPLESKESLEREVLLWDLAGQEDYRLIHQLFLDETALAVVLINPQKQDPFIEVEDWLRALDTALAARDLRRKVVKILVASRMDVGGLRISSRKLNRFLREKDFCGFLPTSAMRGDNCSDQLNGSSPSALKKHILLHIPWNELPWTATPKLISDIKSSVLSMKERGGRRLLRLSEITTSLKDAADINSPSETDIGTAVILLGNHGLVKVLKFGELVLLHPELISSYASALIRAARENIDEIGCIRERDIYSTSFDFHGVNRLDRADEELLLHAIVQMLLDHALCILESADGESLLVFPSQYRRERPIPSFPEVLVSYTFSGERQVIYATLVVRLWYSRVFDQKELWQNAAEFRTSKGQVIGFRMRDLSEEDACVDIFSELGVPDELKVVFFEFVYNHLSKYGENIRRDRRYVCPQCSKLVVDSNVIRERLDNGKKFVFCQRCDTKIPLIDHIERRLTENPITSKVISLDETATQELLNQSLEQILIGHMMAICGEANQIFRPSPMFDFGIDGEVEFRDDDGDPSGRKIYVQLKNGKSYLRTRKRDEKEVFDIQKDRHLEYWRNQPVDVYLVISDEQENIRWMNITRYIKKAPRSRQIIFVGEKLDAQAIRRARAEHLL
ncbi:MAG TPA: DUF4365 domain-containing protein [Thermoanaerobaculia bacterium]|jgi:small GTP-binding protein|nr:DUF4365 domain-containing protein [Thermoanaerobaculia bacterium]